MYIRDKRSPLPKSEAVSRVMSRNRAKNTTPELTLRHLLWHSGLRGYRLHFKIKLPTKSSPPYERSEVAEGRGGSPRPIASVRPDIAFTSKKLAIFVMGCFWHRCPKCAYPLPKNNQQFWKENSTAK